MTPNLLDELEKIVALSEKATDGPFMVDEYADVTANGEDVARIINCDADAHLIAQSVNFLRTHAPALADMAKRMEAAERDAARYRWLRDKAWSAPAKGTSPAVLMVGPDGEQVTNGVAAILDSDKLDAAIDATQEGEG